MNTEIEEQARLVLLMKFMREVADREDLDSDFSIRAMHVLGEDISRISDEDERRILLIRAATQLRSPNDAIVTDNIALLAAAAKATPEDAPLVLSELAELFHHKNHWVACEALTECDAIFEAAGDQISTAEKSFYIGVFCGLDKHDFPGVRATAARALGTVAKQDEVHAAWALTGLKRFARDSESLVREGAMKAAKDIALSQPKHAAQALEILGRRIRDGMPVLRHSALKMACAIGQAVPEQVEKTLRILFHGLKDQKDYVRDANVTEFARFARDTDISGQEKTIESLRARFNRYVEGQEDAKTRRELGRIDRRIGGILKEFGHTPAPAA